MKRSFVVVALLLAACGAEGDGGHPEKDCTEILTARGPFCLSDETESLTICIVDPFPRPEECADAFWCSGGLYCLEPQTYFRDGHFVRHPASCGTERDAERCRGMTLRTVGPASGP